MNAIPVDLAPHLNARAATTDVQRHLGGFNAWGNSFPAEELPFGGTLELRGIPFRLIAADGLDHVEALAQTIEMPAPVRATALALLACGEMGQQEIEVTIDGESFEVIVAGWLADSDADTGGAFVASHLHYPGGYELSRLRPVLWPRVVEWPGVRDVTAIHLSANPLFHVVAMTLLERR